MKTERMTPEERAAEHDVWMWVAEDTIVPLQQRIHDMWGQHPDQEVVLIQRYIGDGTGELRIETSMKLDLTQMVMSGKELWYPFADSLSGWGFSLTRRYSVDRGEYYEIEDEVSVRSKGRRLDSGMKDATFIAIHGRGPERSRANRIIKTDYNQHGVVSETTVAFQ